ncbi:NAD(P)H-hydrate epimerase [Candidatus Peregrinibacteria bacterium CG_4_10_14_0_2_um_filter_43_11]|nr:MAG: NAD(P)H-hydrate epimerase [Candidatus Peregrinibacteria bacterium CG_4_10_14_0_2_um_filter_43_11]
MNNQSLTAEEMQAFEQFVCDRFNITVNEMMQQAGGSVAALARSILNGDEDEGAGSRSLRVSRDEKRKNNRILIICGKGNNGGDVLVATQLLHREGFDVTVFSPYSVIEFTSTAVRELDKVVHSPIPIFDSLKCLDLSSFDLIIDGLFGFSLKGDPRPPANEIIEQIIYSRVPVLAVDVPSGFDVTVGKPQNPTVRATHTLVLGMLKNGLHYHPEVIGNLFFGDIGIPKEAYVAKGYPYPQFVN